MRIPGTSLDGGPNGGFHNKGITWDTPMTRWAGVDNDWIRLCKSGPHKKKMSFLRSYRRCIVLRGGRKEGMVVFLSRRREVLILLLLIPRAAPMALNLSYEVIAKLLSTGSLERPSKKKSEIIDNTQLQLMDWWKQGVELSHRTGDWATHIFREHNKEADRWAGYGAKGREDEWVYDSIIDWSEVSGICGFWDGSCNEH